MSRILIIEDEPNLRNSLCDYLLAEGHEALEARDLPEARLRIKEGVDVAVLDWMLPSGQGIELLREWRAEGWQLPVIFLTARTSLVDKVLGLELGANDYLTKPFEPRELLARIRVQLRQMKQHALSGLADDNVIDSGGIRLNRTTREVSYAEQIVDLKKMEFALLLLFMEHPNQVFSRDEILNRVWGYDSFPTTRTIDTHILQLRHKFSSGLFETVRGIGYRFRVCDI
jgi:DNA-binding response OmpR family regulator